MFQHSTVPKVAVTHPWAILWMGLSVVGWGQGQVIFNNRVAGVVVAPVQAEDPFEPSLIRRANQPPASSMRGALLDGERFTMQLYAGRPGCPDGFLRPIEPAAVFRTGEAAGFVVPDAMTLTIPGVPEGQSARLQVRAWDNRGGTITNWLQVEADASISRGTSLAFMSEPLGGVYAAPPNLLGLCAFSLNQDPKTSVTRIQFVPRGRAAAPGYEADSGEEFGLKPSGSAYGWNSDQTQALRAVESTDAPDERFGHAIQANPGSGATWELAVPNGPYRVRLVVAATADSQQVAHVSVEGISKQSTGVVPGLVWQEMHAVTWVADGRLTLSESDLSPTFGFCFVEVKPLPPVPELIEWRTTYPSSKVHIQLRGIAGTSYEIQGSTNLVSWSRLGVATSLEWDRFLYTDEAMAGGLHCFYRALVLAPH